MAKVKTTKGIDVDRLDQLVKDLGVRARVYKSTLCPNLSSMESMDHSINCKLCDNNMIDFDCIETLVMFQQQDLKEQFKLQGTFHIDEVFATFLSGLTLQTFTKVEILDFEEDFYQLVQRQEGSNFDSLKYKACSVLGIFSIDKSGPTPVIERYYEEADFRVTDGRIEWIGSHKPVDRKIYSIYFKYHPIYRAVKAVHRDRFTQYNERPTQIEAPKKTIGDNTFVKLPETWILKRDYLVENRDQNGELQPINIDYDPNE